MLKHGFLGSPQDIPQSLRGAEVRFKFESPLTEAEEEKKINQFQQVSQLLAQAVDFNPNVGNNVDFQEAIRDSIQGTGAPEKWLRSLEGVRQLDELQKSMMQNQAAQQAAA
jgi:hypothetical protein